MEQNAPITEAVSQFVRHRYRQAALLSKASELLDRLQSIESRIMLEVSTKVDDNGKLVFPNEDMRKAASFLACQTDDEFRCLRAEFIDVTQLLVQNAAAGWACKILAKRSDDSEFKKVLEVIESFEEEG